MASTCHCEHTKGVTKKYNKLVIADLHYLLLLMMMMIIIIIIIILIILSQISFLSTILIFVAVNKSNKVIHIKETNITFKMKMFCDEEETNIFQFLNE